MKIIRQQTQAIILTGDFIDLVLNNQFDIAEFSRMCNARVDFIEPTSGWYYNDKKQLQEAFDKERAEQERLIIKEMEGGE